MLTPHDYLFYDNLIPYTVAGSGVILFWKLLCNFLINKVDLNVSVIYYNDALPLD